MRSADEDDGFLLELEKTARILSLGTDQASTRELRRLFAELQSDGREMIEAVLPAQRVRRS